MREKEKISKILRNLPRKKAFYFFTSVGNYTGESASSLKEFIKKISEVDMKSLEFHLYRGDFEKWITQTLEDEELAIKISNLRNLNYSGIALKQGLYNIVAGRYKELSDKLGIS